MNTHSTHTHTHSTHTHTMFLVTCVGKCTSDFLHTDHTRSVILAKHQVLSSIHSHRVWDQFYPSDIVFCMETSCQLSCQTLAGMEITHPFSCQSLLSCETLAGMETTHPFSCQSLLSCETLAGMETTCPCQMLTLTCIMSIPMSSVSWYGDHMPMSDVNVNLYHVHSHVKC